jgi:raffinose/stachyose/melibiose transport system permease protein
VNDPETIRALQPSVVASTQARERVGRRRRDHRSRADRAFGRSLSGYLFLLPVFAVYVPFVLLPLVHTAFLSLYQWNGLTPGTWAGFANYRALWSDPQLASAFVHSAVLVVFYAVLPIALALFLVSVMSRARIRGAGPYRTLLFLPQIVPTVVVAIAWRWIFAPDGPLNQLLQAIGLGGLARAWLGDFTFALPAVGVIGTWALYGLCMVLFIAGLQKIPQSLYDAAQMDGAGPFAEFLAVTLPGLRGELVVAGTLTIAAAVSSFDLVYVATNGGPGDATTVPSLLVYRLAFSDGRVGGAAAVGTTIAALVFAITMVIRHFGRSPAERDAFA